MNVRVTFSVYDRTKSVNVSKRAILKSQSKDEWIAEVIKTVDKPGVDKGNLTEILGETYDSVKGVTPVKAKK